MAKQKIMPFACPHCKNESGRQVVDRINVDLDPSMREKVRDLSCFAWECPVCGRTSLVLDPCLYHDMSGQFMVWLAPDGTPPEAPEFDPLSEYTLRWTETPNAFREKITILERGLDDRAIEIMKLLLAMQMAHGMDLVDVVFHDCDERTGQFRFAAVLSDGAEQYAAMSPETYARIAQDVRERLFTPLRQFVRIDQTWAAEALELLKESGASAH